MKTLLLSALLFSSSLFYSDEPLYITWDDLNIEEFEDIYVEDLGAYFWSAQFTEEQKKLDQKRVQIKGVLYRYGIADDFFFILGKEEDLNLFGIQADHAASQVIYLEGAELEEKSPKKFIQKDITISGILSVNLEHDIYRGEYEIHEAKISY